MSHDKSEVSTRVMLCNLKLKIMLKVLFLFDPSIHQSPLYMDVVTLYTTWTDMGGFTLKVLESQKHRH